MGDISKEMEMLRENQKEMLEIKNTIREIKDAFTEFISRLRTAWERISELKMIKCKQKGMNPPSPALNIQDLWDTFKRCNMPRRRTRGQSRKNI